jgi:hypothetical protein
MIDDREWRAAYQRVIADGRRRLGEPPTEAELMAWSRGELHGEAKARIDELLAYYPELARTLIGGESPEFDGTDDNTVLSDADLADDWKSLEAKLRRDAPPVPFPPPAVRDARPWYVAAAAALLLGALGWMLLQTRAEVGRLRREHPDGKMSADRTLLMPDGERGAQPHAIELTPDDGDLLLAAALVNQPLFPEYRADILDLRASTPRSIWSATGLPRHPDETVEILLPRGFLKPGMYRLTVSGLGPAESRTLATYTIHISPLQSKS